MSTTPWSLSAQHERRALLFARHREWAAAIFEPDGAYRLVSDRWNPPSPDERKGNDPRVRAWHAFAFFEGAPADIRLANAILRRVEFSPGYDFFVCALLQLCARHSDHLEPDIRERAEACWRATGPEQTSGAGFVGLNDNFPAMSTLILVLAGEWSGRPELVRLGRDRLREFAERLDRDGTIGEYNSPTYTSLTLACMADLARFAADEEVRRLALRIEKQAWYDVCARFHPGTSQMGGPSSRSYTSDSCGQLHNTRYALYAAFGSDTVFIHPLRYAYDDSKRLILHHDDPMFNAANGIWVAAPDYHVPDACGRMMTDRSYPFEVVGTTSSAFLWQPDDWRVTPAGRATERFRPLIVHRYAPALLTTVHTPDWSLGTSSGAHACGDGSQHEAFFVTYRRRRPAAAEALGLEDVRTVYSRYVFNEGQPDVLQGLLHDQGRKTTVQKGGAALVLYRPGITVLQGITSMRLAVILPELFALVDEVWLGAARVPDAGAESGEPQPVFIRDGACLLAFRPLVLTDYGRRAAVRIRRINGFLTIGFYNYEGPGRALNFSYQAPYFTQNGFVFEVAAADEVPFETFRQRVLSATVEDGYVARGVRRVRYTRAGLDLAIEQDPLDEGAIPPAWIDGQPRETPRFRATGVEEIEY